MPIPTRSKSFKVKSTKETSDEPTRQTNPNKSETGSKTQKTQSINSHRQFSNGSSASNSMTSPVTTNAQQIPGNPSFKHVRSSSTVSTILNKSSSLVIDDHVVRRQPPQSRIGQISKTKPPSSNFNSAQSSTGVPFAQVVDNAAGPIPSSTAPQSMFIDRSKAKAPFNTYRQQLSPRKPQLNSTSDSTDDLGHRHIQNEHAVGPFTLQILQNELLQLSLVYQQSTKTLNEFELNIKDILEERSQEIQREADVVRRLETEQQKNLNEKALQDWLGELESSTAATKIRVLSGCIQELSDMQRSSSTLSQTISQFDQWYTSTKTILENRSYPSQNQEIQFIESLQTDWLSTISSLKEKLSFIARALQQLGIVKTDSAIWLITSEYSKLTRTLREQLEAYSNIHQLVMTSESDWIHDQLKEAMAVANLDPQDSSRQPVWNQNGSG